MGALRALPAARAMASRGAHRADQNRPREGRILRLPWLARLVSRRQSRKPEWPLDGHLLPGLEAPPECRAVWPVRRCHFITIAPASWRSIVRTHGPDLAANRDGANSQSTPRPDPGFLEHVRDLGRFSRPGRGFWLFDEGKPPRGRVNTGGRRPFALRCDGPMWPFFAKAISNG